MTDVGRSPHRWRFFRSGGFDQVRLDTAEDLAHLSELDPKLWSVLSCPTSGLEFDTRGAPQTPFDIAKFAGIFAAIGLAIGAIGTALAAVVAGLFNLAWWQFPLVALGVLLAISGPSMLLAWLKLRQRNLAPLLDANGWAVNTRARINLPFGASLTGVAALPAGSQRSLDDPYAEKKRPWKTYLFLAVVAIAVAAAWQQGYLDPLIEQVLERFRSAGSG